MYIGLDGKEMRRKWVLGRAEGDGDVGVRGKGKQLVEEIEVEVEG